MLTGRHTLWLLQPLLIMLRPQSIYFVHWQTDYSVRVLRYKRESGVVLKIIACRGLASAAWHYSLENGSKAVEPQVQRFYYAGSLPPVSARCFTNTRKSVRNPDI